MTSMLKVSEAAIIALHSMVYLSVNMHKPASTKEISKHFEVSENHLSKVMQRLVKAELVESLKGPKGGFKLHKNCEDITFLEILEAIDGPIKQGCCLLGKKICDSSDCIMGDFLKKTNREVKEYFQNKKLSDFINNKT